MISVGWANERREFIGTLERRRNYRNAISGIIDVWRTEGFTRLWRGAVPMMARAALVNGAQLGTYTRAKMTLRDTGCSV